MEVNVQNEERLDRNDYGFLVSFLETMRNETSRAIFFPDVGGAYLATLDLSCDYDHDYRPIGILKITCPQMKMKMNQYVEIRANQALSEDALILRMIKCQIQNKVTDHSVTVSVRDCDHAVREIITGFSNCGKFRKIVKM